MRIDLMEHLRKPDENGWQITPEIDLAEGDYVDDPSKFKNDEPGRVYGPAIVQLMLGPGYSRTLRVR